MVSYHRTDQLNSVLRKMDRDDAVEVQGLSNGLSVYMVWIGKRSLRGIGRHTLVIGYLIFWNGEAYPCGRILLRSEYPHI